MEFAYAHLVKSALRPPIPDMSSSSLHARRVRDGFFKNVVDDGKLVTLIKTWLPDEAMRQTVLIDNPAELYDF